MALPRPVVFGNWKMNGLRADALALAGELAERAVRPTGTIGVFPPATVLGPVAQRLAGTAIMAGGQDCHADAAGAFTGSVSAAMLKDAGASACLVGHSERRHGLGETDEMVQAKAARAIADGLLAVLCIGEIEAEYLAGKTHDRLEAQLVGSLPATATTDNLVLAYEPVWAIGTGRTPTIEAITRTHLFLRERLASLVRGGSEVAILYGGSVKPSNAAEILSVPHVDGALVGGASLSANDFWSIYQGGGGA